MPRFLRLQEGWLTVGLLALVLFSVTLSVQQAQWSEYLSILTPVTILGLISGIVLAKVRGVPRPLLDLVGLLLGVVVVLLSVASVMTEERLVTVQDKVQDLLLRTGGWLGAAVRQEMSDDLLVFILSLAVVSWVLAYSSAYFVFRSRQLWWALVPNGVALLINVSYSSVNLRSYVIIFMFSSLLLMIRFNLLMQEERWQRERVNYSPALSWGFLWAGSALSLILAVAMWFVPTTGTNSTLNNLWTQVDKPWRDFETTMGSMWPTVQGGNRPIGGYSSFNDRFTMGGSLNLSDSEALRIKSAERHYWRGITYDQYNGLGWKNSAPESLTVLPNSSSRLSLAANQQLSSDDKARREVTYTVQIKHPKDDKLFATSRPVELSVESRLNVSWHTLNQVYNVESTSLLSVSLELRILLGELKEAQRELREKGNCDPSLDANACVYATTRGPIVRQQIENLGKRGLTVTFDVAPNANFAMNLRASGEVPVYDDLTSVHAVGSVAAGTTYTVTSLVSQADAAELRAADTTYDDWVTERYLSIPATVPQRVRDLAQKIVQDAGATNAYDKGKAIETYLRQNFKYSTNIAVPPSGMDRIDWFLFQGKEGYCEYYAGAMTIMMRSVGVPTRLAGGYAPGTYDAKSGMYIIRESDAHTWPELYFPGYGWIEFEPTPSQAVVAHEIPAEPTVGEPSPSPSVSASPSASPDDALLNNLDEKRRLKLASDAAAAQWQAPFGVAVVLALGLLAVFTWWIPILPWARKERVFGDAGHYYRSMLRWSRLLGVGPAAHMTPYEFSEALAREVPGSSLYTRSIARAYVRERYGKAPTEHEERVLVHRSWDSLRSRFLRALPGRQVKRAARKRR